MKHKDKKVKRNRSLTGCSTCRQRHVKCDEARPACHMCQAFGVPCPGYRPQLKWTNDGAQRPQSVDDATFRRALFAEPQQQAMTQIMAGSLGQLSVGKALDGLEVDDAEKPVTAQPRKRPRDRFYGPFGVLYVAIGASSKSSPLSDTGCVEAGDSTLLEPKHASTIPRPSDASKELCQPEHQNTFLQLTPNLLNYFKRHVVSFTYAARQDATMCPWQNIHIPAAEETYGQMLRHDTPTPTGLSLLHSLLASSCYHLAPRDSTSAGKWVELGDQYKQEARQYLDVAIQEEMLSLAQTKYEELLMALLSITMLEILCANYDEAEYLLLEAEYLIRTRGLPTPRKSPQLRTLHHVYTYLRVLTESTCGCILRNICPAKPGSRSSLVTEESRHKLRSFRVADQSTESDLCMGVEKGTAAAHEDIHLEMMGDWSESLFPQLYGLPESLLGLLSQTIRLVNEQELLQRDAHVDVSMIANLCRRTKVLEHSILSWKLPCEDATPDGPNTGGQFIPRLAEVFHQGVILFYYRRVQNINALMLQDRVRKVLDSLSTADGSYEAAQLLWPVFMAACEAIEPPLRDGLGEWLGHMGGKSKIPAFRAVEDLAKQVWALREEKEDYTLSWFDVTNQERCPIVAL